MSSASIKAEIDKLSAELEEKKKLLKQIEEAIKAVDSAWAGVNDTGYKNSFGFIKNNSSNYWNVVDKSGNSCGDVVSFNDSLDDLSEEISGGEVASAMGEVMAKAAEKMAELQEQIATLEAEIARLEELYQQALAEEEAARKAAEEALSRAEADGSEIN